MEFESKSGTTYYYDNEIGIAFPSSPLLKKLIDNSLLQKDDISSAENAEEFLFYSAFLKKLDKVRPKQNSQRQHQLQADDVRRMILREGLTQLILGITEDCNLRCRYCVYSDAYALSRNRSDNAMDFTTAKKAMDYYASLILEGRQYNPVRRPAIGFYGGEPLLNFDLIKKCVKYLKTTYPELDFHYSVTTNGTLLNKEKEDFFREHGFFISISIDGPKKEHDRNRVYPNGKGTFTDVMKNVRRMVADRYEDCQAICVFDWKSDIFALDAFFNQSDIPRLSIIALPARQDGCRYYDQFSEEDFLTFQKNEELAFQYYLEHPSLDMARTSFFGQLYSINGSRFIYSVPVLVPREQRIIPYSGACTLGRKIFVDVLGTFHPCERINHFFPIGDIRSGLNYTKIAGIMNDYREHLDSCGTCGVNNTCGYCYNHFAKEGCFNYASRVCKSEEKVKRKEFSRTFTVGEKYPHQLDAVVRNYYSWLSKVSPTLGD